MTNKNQRGEIKGRNTGDLEAKRNRTYNAIGDDTDKSRPQPPREPAPTVTPERQTQLKEDVDHLHTQWRSLNTKFHQAIWAYVEGVTGFTKDDVVQFKGNTKTDWKIIDCVRKHNNNSYNLVIKPIQLYGTGDTQYHRVVSKHTKRIPVTKLKEFDIIMSPTVLIARPHHWKDK